MKINVTVFYLSRGGVSHKHFFTGICTVHDVVRTPVYITNRESHTVANNKPRFIAPPRLTDLYDVQTTRGANTTGKPEGKPRESEVEGIFSNPIVVSL